MKISSTHARIAISFVKAFFHHDCTVDWLFMVQLEGEMEKNEKFK
jgi:hypothetical protein